MTDQNNAAQAADTTPFSDEYVNAVIQQHGYDSPECVIARLHQWIGLHGGENGVTLLMYEAHKALVKLRTPVADERAAVDPCGYVAVKVSAVDWLKKHFPALTIRAGLCERFAGRLYTITRLMSDHDAAMASAPVAGEAPGTNRQGLLEAIHRYGNARAMAEHNIAYRDEVRKTAGALVALFDAAPQASTVDGLPVWWERFMNELTLRSEDEVRNDLAGILEICALDAIASAAPQASEAVRIQFPAHLRKMWSGGEVQAWLDEHQGVTPPKVSAKGSLERYRKWQAEREEAFGAGVKAAADLVKKTVEDYDANHGSTDCETGTREYPGEGATWVCEMQELEESIRALSAQRARKPATSAPSPAASQRQAMIPASRESGNSHTDGGAVYE